MADSSVALTTNTTSATAATPAKRNVPIFVADGLRNGAVNATDMPTLYALRNSGVNFSNSYSLFPTFTTPNAKAVLPQFVAVMQPL